VEQRPTHNPAHRQPKPCQLTGAGLCASRTMWVAGIPSASASTALYWATGMCGRAARCTVGRCSPQSTLTCKQYPGRVRRCMAVLQLSIGRRVHRSTHACRCSMHSSRPEATATKSARGHALIATAQTARPAPTICSTIGQARTVRRPTPTRNGMAGTADRGGRWSSKRRSRTWQWWQQKAEQAEG